MGRMKDLYMEEEARKAAAAGNPCPVDPYDLYVAETALAKIAGGAANPADVARQALAKISADESGVTARAAYRRSIEEFPF